LERPEDKKLSELLLYSVHSSWCRDRLSCYLESSVLCSEDVSSSTVSAHWMYQNKLLSSCSASLYVS